MERRDFLLMAGMAASAGRALGGGHWALGRSPVSQPDGVTNQTDARVESIAALVTAKMAEYHVPGVALGIVKNGQTTVRGFGVTSVDEPQPITPETIFTIASISKTFTATAVMKLIEQGKAELKAPIQRYVPDFRVQ